MLSIEIMCAIPTFPTDDGEAIALKTCIMTTKLYIALDDGSQG